MNYSLEGLLARDMKGIFVVRFCTTLRDELVALALAAIVGSVVRFTLSKPLGNVLSCAALSNPKLFSSDNYDDERRNSSMILVFFF